MPDTLAPTAGPSPVVPPRPTAPLPNFGRPLAPAAAAPVAAPVWSPTAPHVVAYAKTAPAAAKPKLFRAMRVVSVHPEWIQLAHGGGVSSFDSVAPAKIAGKVTMGDTVYCYGDDPKTRTYSLEPQE